MAGFEDEVLNTLLKPLCVAPDALGLSDDVARLRIREAHTCVTMDTLVEGVHFRRTDPLESVGWKSLAVNVSDIAAKGMLPRSALLSVAWPRDTSLDQAAQFFRSLGEALIAYDVSLLGGDTVRTDGPLVITITLTGEGERPPVLRKLRSERGASEELDLLVFDRPWIIGAAGLGLAVLDGHLKGPEAPELEQKWVEAFQRPAPDARLIAAVVQRSAWASMDVSDGLLTDAARLAAINGMGVEIDLSALPLGGNFSADVDMALRLAVSGDDYTPLIAAPLGTAQREPLLRRIGRLQASAGRMLRFADQVLDWPEKDGWRHD